MTPSLTITDRQSGKAYNVPEDREVFTAFIFNYKEKWFNTPMYLAFEQAEFGPLNFQWVWHGINRAQVLDPNRFTVSFSNSLSKETVREALKEVRQEQLDKCEYTLPSSSFWAISRIASSLSINLEETTNGN